MNVDLCSNIDKVYNQALIDFCKEWSITDKVLEHWMLWPRTAVRQFRDNHPEFDWEGFIWANI